VTNLKNNHNIKLKVFGRTDKGRVRNNNEDNFLIGDISLQNWRFSTLGNNWNPGTNGVILAVADGMGGQTAGEVASNIAIESFKKTFSKIEKKKVNSFDYIRNFLKKAIISAHKDIVEYGKSNENYRNMGTTATIAWIIDNTVYIAWSGDSRCYIYRPGKGLSLLTSDHSLVWDLVLNGKLTPEEATQHPDRNIITQSLGDINNPPKPSFNFQDLQSGDRLLLCTDGLTSMVSDSLIQSILSQNNEVADTSKILIDAANTAGGDDNITVILLDVIETPESDVHKKNFKPWFIYAIIAIFFTLIGYTIGYYRHINIKSSAHTLSPKIQDTIYQKIQPPVIPKNTEKDTIKTDTVTSKLEPAQESKNKSKNTRKESKTNIKKEKKPNNKESIQLEGKIPDSEKSSNYDSINIKDKKENKNETM